MCIQRQGFASRSTGSRQAAGWKISIIFSKMVRLRPNILLARITSGLTKRPHPPAPLSLRERGETGHPGGTRAACAAWMPCPAPPPLAGAGVGGGVIQIRVSPNCWLGASTIPELFRANKILEKRIKVPRCRTPCRSSRSRSACRTAGEAGLSPDQTFASSPHNAYDEENVTQLKSALQDTLPAELTAAAFGPAPQ